MRFRQVAKTRVTPCHSAAGCDASRYGTLGHVRSKSQSLKQLVDEAQQRTISPCNEAIVATVLSNPFPPV
jgi:hypothetical protein